MNVRKIRLRGFRSYHSAEVEFAPGLNILLGENGQGKTNLLESIYFMSTTKSHRGATDAEMIQYGEDFFTIDALMNDPDHLIDSCSAVIHKKGKTFCVNKNAVKRISDYVGKINAVIFSPVDMTLFDASPKARRRFMDIEIGKISHIYLSALSRYNQLLKERNALLKREYVQPELLEAIDQQMHRPQIEIIRQRKIFIDQLNRQISQLYERISGTEEKVFIRYFPTVPFQSDEQLMREELSQKQEASRERDIATGMTNTGIQREDIGFLLNAHPVEAYASQGQKRMVIIAQKLSLLEFIRERTQEYPILLLDDVLSELDPKRRNALVELLPDNVQTVITATDESSLDPGLLEKANLMEVKKGSVLPWQKTSTRN